MEADIDGDLDAKKIAEVTGVKTIQLHTGGMRHLDAGMTKQGLEAIEDGSLDLIILANVANLVCPAEFDTGAHLSMVILIVPEEDDKPLKYPLMFQEASVVAVNKVDVAPYFDFDFARCEHYIRLRNKDCEIYKVSALKGEGIEELASYLDSRIKENKNG